MTLVPENAPCEEDAPSRGKVLDARWNGYAWWSGLAVVLLGAAALKAHQVATEPELSTSFFQLRPFVIGSIWFEVLLGSWMLAGLHRRITRWLVIACFGAFAAVAVALALGGAESCGCFGRVHVNPWYTSALDAALALGVWLFPGSRFPSPSVFDAPGRSVTAIVVALALTGTLTAGMVVSKLSMLSAEEPLLGRGPVVVLKPETWVGMKFPLLRHIEIDSTSAELSKGNWLVVLYRHDCSHCQEVVPKIRIRAADEPGDKVLLVEMPPYGSPSEQLIGQSVQNPGGLIVGRLNNAREWFVDTPSLIELENGVVRRIPKSPFGAELERGTRWIPE